MKTEDELWEQWQDTYSDTWGLFDLFLDQQRDMFEEWLTENYTEVDGLWRHNEN